MIPGRPVTVKCPSCSMLQLRRTLLSGNTLGARYYSDGKCDAPMLPEYPYYVKCPVCEAFFKIKESLCRKSSSDDNSEMPFVSFLSVDELCIAIEKGLYNGNKKDVLPLRILLWRGFNDRVRDGGSNLFREKDSGEDDKAIYEDNCRAILSLLAKNKEDENLLVQAEVFRNLGEFDKCKKLLEKIKSPDKFIVYISSISKACGAKSTVTVCVENE